MIPGTGSSPAADASTSEVYRTGPGHRQEPNRAYDPVGVFDPTGARARPAHSASTL